MNYMLYKKAYNKNRANFRIKLDAEISVWMQSRFDGFDFSATLCLGLGQP